MRDPKRIVELLKLIEAELAFEHVFSISRNYGKTFSITFHDVGTYGDGTELLRSFGVGERKKTIIDEDSDRPWSSLEGESEGVKYDAFCQTIPPSCHRVVETVRIPKKETVDTGEFIEIQQSRVVCGSAP